MNRTETNTITSLEPAKPAEKESLPRVTKEDLGFGEFSKQLAYVETNRELVKTFVSLLPNNFTCVDVATGTGLAVQLIKEKATKQNKTGNIIGIDPNVTSLNIAGKNVLETDKIKVEFIEGEGQNLKRLLDRLDGKILKNGVDGVSILDALHEIENDEEKEMIIKSMANILKPGGLFVFNSAFTKKGITEDTRSWGKWKLEAMKILKKERNKQAATMPILSPEEYREMIENAGLVVVCEKTKSVNLTKEALAAISKYEVFSRGVFKDMCEEGKISDVEKSNALIEALENLKIISLSRVWYEIIAEKPL